MVHIAMLSTWESTWCLDILQDRIQVIQGAWAYFNKSVARGMEVPNTVLLTVHWEDKNNNKLFYMSTEIDLENTMMNESCNYILSSHSMSIWGLSIFWNILPFLLSVSQSYHCEKSLTSLVGLVISYFSGFLIGNLIVCLISDGIANNREYLSVHTHVIVGIDITTNRATSLHDVFPKT